ncbi:MAG: metal ABC transporter solute-binding protein, Zn/Mn family [Anaerolineae bacterium]
MRRWYFLIAASLLLSLGATGCGPGSGAEGEAVPLKVTVSVVPQAYFVERIGGEHVSVNVMVEPGASPATYEPKPEQLAALSHSVAYFSIGVPFEDVWLDRIAEANPDMRIVDTAAGIERRSLDAHSHEEEEDGHEEHPQGVPDPHIWLSPELVKTQARNIHAALVELDPAHEAEYTANLEAFLADIEALQSEIRATLSDVENRTFMVFHPSWGYFADEFGLTQIPIEVGGQEPSAQELAALIEKAKEEEVKVIFAQPEFSTKAAETIAQEIGGEVLLITPLARDWLTNLQEVADAFARVLAE